MIYVQIILLPMHLFLHFSLFTVIMNAETKAFAIKGCINKIGIQKATI